MGAASSRINNVDGVPAVVVMEVRNVGNGGTFRQYSTWKTLTRR
jgi:hypothetical protein